MQVNGKSDYSEINITEKAGKKSTEPKEIILFNGEAEKTTDANSLEAKRRDLMSLDGKTAKLFDFNNDGELSLEEREAFYAYIGDRRFDINMDGKLDENEMNAKKAYEARMENYAGRRVTTIEDNNQAWQEAWENADTPEEGMYGRIERTGSALRSGYKGKKDKTDSSEKS